MNWFEQGGPLALVVWLNQRVGQPAAGAVLAFHHAGQGISYLLLLAPIYWSVQPALGRRLAVRFMLSACLNSWAKSLFLRPRPFQLSADIVPLVSESTPGLPSGHAQHAVTVWGTIARGAARRTVTAAVVLWCLAMGLSRMAAGVHYPQDVVVGWLLGLGVIIGCERAEARWLPALRGATPRRQMEIAALAVLVAGLVTRLTALRRPAVLDEVAAPMGMMLGLLFGVVWERAALRFRPATGLPARIVGALLGLVTLLGLQQALVHRGQPVAAEFGAHVVLGWWVAHGVPWLLTRLSLAGRDEETRP